MAYTKKVVKRTYRRKTRKPNTIKKLNNKVNRMYSQLKPELKISESNVENKSIGDPSGGLSTEYLQMIIPDPSLTSGTSFDNQRVGSHIRIRSIQLKAFLRLNPSSPLACNVRFLLVRFPKDTVYPLSLILESISQNLAIVAPFQANTRQNFQVIMDKRVTLNPYGNESRVMNFFKKVNFPVVYLTDGTSVESGQMILYVFSEILASSSSCPLLTLWNRVRYTDV